MSWMLYLFPPTIVVDGHAYRDKWATYYYELPPGRHRVEVFFRYLMRRAGYNSLDVELQPGQVRSIEYRAPFFLFRKGLIAEVPYA